MNWGLVGEEGIVEIFPFFPYYPHFPSYPLILPQSPCMVPPMSDEILNSPYSAYILAAYGIVTLGLLVFAVTGWQRFSRVRRQFDA